MYPTNCENIYDFKAIRLLKDLQNELCLSDQFLADLMNVSTDYLSNIKRGKIKLTTTEFLNIANYFNFTLETVYKNDVDIDVIKNHYLLQQKSYLPAKYTYCAHSKKIMISNILYYVDEFYSPKLKKYAMETFQINDSIFTDMEKDKVNVWFFEDLINFLKKHGLTDRDVWRIGANMISTTTNTMFSKAMSSFSNPKEMYEVYLNELLKEVEQNNNYKVHFLGENSCVLRSYEKESLQENFKVKHIGGINRCIYRAGALANATSYLGLPASFVQETRCVHRGDEHCEFVINFEVPNFYLNENNRRPSSEKVQ